MPITVRHDVPAPTVGELAWRTGVSTGRVQNLALEEEQARIDEQLAFKAEQAAMDRNLRTEQAQLDREMRVGMQQMQDLQQEKMLGLRHGYGESEADAAMQRAQEMDQWKYTATQQRQRQQIMDSIAQVEADQRLTPSQKQHALAQLYARMHNIKKLPVEREGHDIGEVYVDDSGVEMVMGKDGIPEATQRQQHLWDLEKIEKQNIQKTEERERKQEEFKIKRQEKIEAAYQKRLDSIQKRQDKLVDQKMKLDAAVHKQVEAEAKNMAKNPILGPTAQERQLAYTRVMSGMKDQYERIEKEMKEVDQLELDLRREADRQMREPVAQEPAPQAGAQEAQPEIEAKISDILKKARRAKQAGHMATVKFLMNQYDELMGTAQ